MTSLQQNNSQTMNIFGDSNSCEEPNIRKAKFTIGSKRFYTLEFDQNIEMQELKTMIQKHILRKILLVYSMKEQITPVTQMKHLILYFQIKI